MVTKISTSPRVWAKSLGLVAVPMFGGDRSEEPGDEHAILLDGPRASLAFTVGDADSLVHLDEPMSWAWSTNVVHSVVLDRGGNQLYTKRWDRPGQAKRWPMPSERDVGEFFEALTKDEKPTEQTVIAKLLDVFWTLRTNIERRNGTETDLIRSFNAILVWADAIRRPRIGYSVPDGLKTLREIVPILKRYKLIDFGLDALSSDAVRSFPAGMMLDEILKRDPKTRVVLVGLSPFPLLH